MELDILIRKIKAIIIQEYNCPSDFMTTKSRKRKDYITPRQVMMKCLRLFTELSTADIGALFGKDHATVLHATGVVDDLSSTNREYASKLSKVFAKCKEIANEDKISLLTMAKNYVDEFIRLGVYDFKDTDYYGLYINNHIWNNDLIISQLISYCANKNIKIKYNSNNNAESYLLFHKDNFQ